ncbi:MAG: YecA family protein [Thermoplasmata archaeon]
MQPDYGREGVGKSSVNNDDDEFEVDDRISELRRLAENIYRKVGRNDPCPCGSGKKFKNCCLPIITERKKMQPVEDRIRAFLKKYEDSHEDEFSAAMKAFNFGDRIVTDDDMERVMDWIFHDYIVPDRNATVAESALNQYGSTLTEDERSILKQWSRSCFNLYTVTSVKRGVGYDVEDMYVDPGKKLFVADTLSSITMRKFELLFFRLYDFGKFQRIAGGLVHGPYRMKEDFLSLINETWKSFATEMGYGDVPADRNQRIMFMKSRSRELLHGLVEVSERLSVQHYVTSEGHELKFCEGKFKSANDSQIVRILEKRNDFLRSDDSSKDSFKWIRSEGRIPVNDRDQAKRGDLVFLTRVTVPGSSKQVEREGYDIFGDVEIVRGIMFISAVSVERYEALKSLLSEILGDLMGSKIDETFSDASNPSGSRDSEEELDQESSEPSSIDESEEPEWPSEEEIRRRFAEEMYITKEYEKWIDTPIPSLKGLTPREASKREDMKQKLKDMLREIEYSRAEKDVFALGFLRSELGIYEE